jgi:hypothetical protein
MKYLKCQNCGNKCLVKDSPVECEKCCFINFVLSENNFNDFEKNIERRQDLVLRDEYDRTLINCRDILQCYSIDLREKVLLNYLNAYNVLCNDCARGRLIIQLREEKILQ